MAEIRHLKNRHDVIFFCRRWSDLDNISGTSAEWHFDGGDMVEIETGNEFFCTSSLSSCSLSTMTLARIHTLIIKKKTVCAQKVVTRFCTTHN